ncbi:hypothetical protein BOX15_Mlig001756g1 [Macrostomum lignano]|uniref:WSC domain-containing protein n=1 Tax=Macrostomum lignano TaxID=282301 RepID=A0A267H7I5_9PLAT|nr:hypothetical protein BOX15_Mlig001756g1 [Macrostomum lignano]
MATQPLPAILVCLCLAAGCAEALTSLGCYVDKGSDRDLPVLHHSSSTTPESCVSRCKSQNYKYAGLQASNWCLCGNSYGKHGKASDSDCKMACGGDSSKTCGGAYRNEVYPTGFVPGQ